MRTPLSSVAALTVVVTIGCATNPRPGEPGYPHNVEGVYASTFVVDGTDFHGTTELETLEGGAVRGDFAIDRPATIVGELTGTLSGDSLAFSGAYTQADGCDGTVSGSGVVTVGGGRVEGPMRVDDSCGGVLPGRFDFDRSEG